nr:PREDICTED: uncharacterized protein LOC103972899 [Musa acuminata subsp. malaccensis]
MFNGHTHPKGWPLNVHSISALEEQDGNEISFSRSVFVVRSIIHRTRPYSKGDEPFPFHLLPFLCPLRYTDKKITILAFSFLGLFLAALRNLSEKQLLGFQSTPSLYVLIISKGAGVVFTKLRGGVEGDRSMSMAMPWELAVYIVNMVWDALDGWISSCLSVADEIADVLRAANSATA